MSDDLLTWLRAQLDEDERIALDAGGAWNAGGGAWMELPDTPWVLTAPVPITQWKPPNSDRNIGTIPREWDRAHIVRHDPARVLREVEAKRRILNDVLPTMQADEMRIAGEWGVGSEPVREASDDLLSLLALPYADRPGYRDEWRP